MSFLSSIFSMGGAAVSASGSLQAAQGDRQAAAAATATGLYNQAADEQQAEQTQAAAAANAAGVARKNVLTAGEIGAAYGAAGVEGVTPLMVMQDQAVQGELTRRLTLYQGDVAAANLRTRGQLAAYEGRTVATADNYRAEAATVQAGSSLLTAAGNMAKNAPSIASLLASAG